jgi:serine protease
VADPHPAIQIIGWEDDLEIAHTYRGDLRLTLSKGADRFIVFDHDGGSADNLMQTFSVTGLVGKPLAGAWKLEVEDTSGAIFGTLKSWTLEVRTN